MVYLLNLDEGSDISGNIQEPPPGCFHENTDYGGMTICPNGQKCPWCPLGGCDEPYTRNVPSASECQLICQTAVNLAVSCEYFVYDQRGDQTGWCWLKWGKYVVYSEPGTTAGPKYC